MKGLKPDLLTRVRIIFFIPFSPQKPPLSTLFPLPQRHPPISSHQSEVGKGYFSIDPDERF
jgi:hypothetical protein